MATPPEAVAIIQAPSTLNTDNVRRAREFYKYIQPSNLIHPRNRRKGSTFDGRHDHVPSLSYMLSSFCQLAAVRCNAPKAMLNVMDRDMMYFLAEANIIQKESGEKEFREDPIMMACSSVPISGRICEMTLRIEKDSTFPGVPMFTIPDLADSDYASLSVVAGPPYYRFYAGTPITTRTGINVGSLAVMDTEPRLSLTETEEDFLGQTAGQIMAYLETNRQAIEGRRSRQMAKGQEAFIAGKWSLDTDIEHSLPDGSMSHRHHHTYGLTSPIRESDELFAEEMPTTIEREDSKPASLQRRGSSASDSSTGDESTQPTRDSETEPRSHSRTFARAANLLRESFGELGDEGVVMFVTRRGRLNGLKSEDTAAFNPDLDRHSTDVPVIEITNVGTSPTVKVLACSTEESPSNTDIDTFKTPSSLTEAFVKELTRRYPHGKLWSYDANGRLSSSEEDANMDAASQSTRSSKNSRWTKLEGKSLLAAFPSARQLLFTPIWDPDIGACAHAAFVCAALETRPMGIPELSFSNSFCSSVMAECSRLDTELADKQKSDFVGVISHEMRSPLHGILASVEFLADTELSGFQRSLIDTVDSCGRTLLDTINHVLDYSKVNSFQKHWQASNRRTSQQSWKKNHLGPDAGSKALPHGAPPLLQLFGVTDIGAVLEEVVEGLVFGDMYSSGVDITDVSREARGRGGSTQNNGNNTDDEASGRNVQVLIDIQRADWMYLTQPGALRRIIMNITGNALKYTTQGSVTVKLELRKPATTTAKDDGTDLMVLTVVDTGRGISQAFIKSRLFTPFAQENSLAPGTGLGMSIVHSIVTMLGGTIDVRSEVAKGTTVQVSLPLKRPLPGQHSTASTPQSAGTVQSTSSNVDESINLLRQQASDYTVAIFNPRSTSQSSETHQIISKYVQDWYGLDVIDSKLLSFANVVITEEKDLELLVQRLVGTPGSRPALVVICNMISRHSVNNIASLQNRINGVIEFVSRPCGPHKLAKGIRLALEKLKAIRPRFKKVASLGVIPEQPSPLPPTFSSHSTHDSMTDGLQEMDLNSPGQCDINMVVQATETFAASQASHNAHMAITGPTPGSRSGTSQEEGDSFPFPQQQSCTVDSPARPVNGSATLNGDISSEAFHMPNDPPKVRRPSTSLVDPPILLVDDNKINLKLLETYLRNKRKYTRISTAENGERALRVAVSVDSPFEIIFMDISMPVMNGFEATRAIRAHEKAMKKNGALIIALTGLASGRDQSEGFESGCDLYMTKPVSFKQVGKLLDNWEAHYRLQNESKPDLSLLQEVVKVDSTGLF